MATPSYKRLLFFISDGSAYMHDTDVDIFTYGLPWWFSGKESTCNTGDAGDMGSIPEFRRFPGEGHVFHSSIPACKVPRTVDYSPWDQKESDMTEEHRYRCT